MKYKKNSQNQKSQFQNINSNLRPETSITCYLYVSATTLCKFISFFKMFFFKNINRLIFMCFYTFIIGCHRLLTLFFNKFVKVGRILIEWTGLRQCIQGVFSRPLYVSKLKIWVRYCQLTLWVKIRGYNKRNWKYIAFSPSSISDNS